MKYTEKQIPPSLLSPYLHFVMPLYSLSLDTWMIHVVDNFLRQNTVVDHSESVCKKLGHSLLYFAPVHVPDLFVSNVCERIPDLFD